jgi:hypothetical protein
MLLLIRLLRGVLIAEPCIYICRRKQVPVAAGIFRPAFALPLVLDAIAFVENHS